MSTLNPTQKFEALTSAIRKAEQEAEFRQGQADGFYAVSPEGEGAKAFMQRQADEARYVAEVLTAAAEALVAETRA